MKLKAHTINLGIIAIVLLLFISGCSKDPNEEMNNDLSGSWDVRSFTIDGVEAIPSAITTFEMDFRMETETTGSTEWFFISSTGQATKAEGDYEVIREGTELDFEGDRFDISLSNGNDLSLSGTVDAQRWEIVADKD